ATNSEFPHKGKIITRAQVSDRPNKGAIYMTYQWWIGACNELVTEKNRLNAKSSSTFCFLACFCFTRAGMDARAIAVGAAVGFSHIEIVIVPL
ncbi:molybdopterin dinucleotide binding domain-containing protein, partial [Escherichia coli]